MIRDDIGWWNCEPSKGTYTMRSSNVHWISVAVRGTGGEHRVIVVNRDLAQNEHVRLAATGQKATILRLTAHSAESKSGLTFGGASVDPNGDWAPRVAESVTLESDRFVVDLPAASAAVVQIHAG